MKKIVRFEKVLLLTFAFMAITIYMFNVFFELNFMPSTNDFLIGIILTIYCINFILDRIYENLKDVDEVDNYYHSIRGSVRVAVPTIKSASDLPKIDGKSISSKQEANSADIIELMLLNMKEIKEYYVMSKNMAKKSFMLAVVMCILGFVIIASSIIFVLFMNVSFLESLVPVIGGTIVEVIAGTSLSVYRKSLEQLNQYYESLHNNERYLSLVNLVDKLSDDKKDETYISIINSQLDVLKYSP